MENLFNVDSKSFLFCIKTTLLFVFFSLLFTSPKLYAQKRFTFGFQYGVGVTGILKEKENVSLIFDSIGKGKYKLQSNFVLGLNSMYFFGKNNKWNLNLDLTYNFFRTSFEKESPPFFVGFETRNTESEYYLFDYISLPIKLTYNSKIFHYFVGAKYAYNYEAEIFSDVYSFAIPTIQINRTVVFNTRNNAKFESLHELKFLFGAGFNLSDKIRMSVEYSDYLLNNKIEGRDSLGIQLLYYQTNSIVFFITHLF